MHFFAFRVKWKAQSLEQAEAWVRHLVATREVPNTLAFMLTEWKKNKDLVRCVGTAFTSSKMGFLAFLAFDRSRYPRTTATMIQRWNSYIFGQYFFYAGRLSRDEDIRFLL